VRRDLREHRDVQGRLLFGGLPHARQRMRRRPSVPPAPHLPL
jgi:hypothetical protein